MNRHQRRRAEKVARHNKFYTTYVRHLPRVAADAPFERGKIYHVVFNHDAWCAFYDDKACNCNPTVTRHIEPERS